MGSSPRVRGTQIDELLAVFDMGIIPACAGNTIAPPAGGRGCRDHPRVCGEHIAVDELANRRAGSSPRVRGTHDPCGRPDSGEGIIPACAGNTKRRPGTPRLAVDHPRVCGEHMQCCLVYAVIWGSSPRVRGTQRFGHPFPVACGIIPACAGNTRCRLPRAARWWDHPRVCGEHITGNADDAVKAGSSPRVRGTPSGYESP